MTRGNESGSGKAALYTRIVIPKRRESRYSLPQRIEGLGVWTEHEIQEVDESGEQDSNDSSERWRQ